MGKRNWDAAGLRALRTPTSSQALGPPSQQTAPCCHGSSLPTYPMVPWLPTPGKLACFVSFLK